MERNHDFRWKQSIRIPGEASKSMNDGRVTLMLGKP